MLNGAKNILNFLLLKKYYKETHKIKLYISNIKKNLCYSNFDNLKDDIFNDRIKLFAYIYIVVENELKIKTHDFQLLAALLMCDGYIIDMKTGEGKTITSIYTTIFLSKKGQVHIVTVNDVLAERDFNYSLPVLRKFCIESGANSGACDKQALLKLDVIYTSSTEIVFDYLRTLQNGMSMLLNQVIIDEIDYVLIDNANSKCSISETVNEDSRIKVFRKATEISDNLKGIEAQKDCLKTDSFIESTENYDYTYSFYNHTIDLSDNGVKKIKESYGIDVYSDSLFLGALLYCIEAKHLFIKDVDYKITDGRLNIINKENGRLLQNCTYSDEIQLALEIKENCIISGEKSDSENILYQIFFKKYRFLTGMSGTAYLGREEFKLIFNKDVTVVPIQRKVKRIDLPDIILKTKEDKYDKLLKLMETYSESRNPIVIICESDLESEKVYKMIKDTYHVKLLNNNTAFGEEEYVASAGEKGSILVTTNMVGRGTDIKINNEVDYDGGLTVVVMKRYANRRIDAQVMGRAGRQGNSGLSQFLVSLDDDIFKYIDSGFITKFTKLDQKVFSSSKVQSRLRKLVKFTQDVISAQLLDSRTREFNFESIIDAVKSYYSGSYFIDNFVNAIINKVSSNSEFSEKYNSLGEQVSKLILIELYKYLFKSFWRDFLIYCTNLKQDINLKVIDKNHIYTEFINEISKEIKKIETELEDAVINAFTTVNLV